MRIHELLFELFDHTPEILRTTNSGQNTSFQHIENDFEVNNRRYRCEIKIKMITVNFKSKTDSDDWTISRQSNQPSPTKVFGSVINILMPHITAHPTFNIFFRSEESGSRERLYDVIATNLAKSLGRQLKVERHTNKGAGYTIVGDGHEIA